MPSLALDFLGAWCTEARPPSCPRPCLAGPTLRSAGRAGQEWEGAGGEGQGWGGEAARDACCRAL